MNKQIHGNDHNITRQQNLKQKFPTYNLLLIS